MFIAIEGIDGVGKTSLCKLLCERNNFIYRDQKILSQYLNIDEKDYLTYCSNLRNSVKGSFTEMYWFYAMNCILDAYDKQENSIIICDRHMLTLDFWYGNIENQTIPQTIYKLCGKPDLTIVLTASAAITEERVRQRCSLENASYTYMDREINKARKANEFMDKAIRYCEMHELKYYVISTDNMSLEDIYNKAIKIIELNR